MRLLCPALLLCLALASSAEARRTASFAYPGSRVWVTAVRLLRVDFQSPISEKDRDVGYFLFDFPHEGKLYPGSVEVIAGGDQKRPEVRVVVQIAALPSYVELMILERLERRLRQDFGSPQRPSTEPKAPSKEPSEDRPKEGDAQDPAVEPKPAPR